MGRVRLLISTAQPAADLPAKPVDQLGAVLILPGRDIIELKPHAPEMTDGFQT